MSTAEQQTTTSRDAATDDPRGADERGTAKQRFAGDTQYGTEQSTGDTLVSERAGTEPQDTDAGMAHRSSADPMTDDRGDGSGVAADERATPRDATDEPVRADEERRETWQVTEDADVPRQRSAEPSMEASAPAPAAEPAAGGLTGSAMAGERPAESRPSGADGESRKDRERLVPADRADSYSTRWNEVKGLFVDDPRQAVRQADGLVGELLEELESLFRNQRSDIEHGLDNDDTSTEDLRMALRRYRAFFDRLLSV